MRVVSASAAARLLTGAMLLCLAASATTAMGGPEFNELLRKMGFDLHHRTFITKLHEKGMLSFLGDKVAKNRSISDPFQIHI